MLRACACLARLYTHVVPASCNSWVEVNALNLYACVCRLTCCDVCAGEMVVDETDLAGQQQRRRFLIYDIMMLGGEGVADLRFAVRWWLGALCS